MLKLDAIATTSFQMEDRPKLYATLYPNPSQGAFRIMVRIG